MISSQERNTLHQNIEKYEGRIPYMYLDSRGYVTVAVGNLLATVEDAQKLPFIHADGSPASADEIAADYNAVKAQPVNKVATYYQPFTRLHLSDETIDQLTDDHIDSFYKELKVIYSNFDDFPEEVQLATFDLIFNLGMTKLKNRWPKFNGCIAENNWQGAAEECQRRGVAQSRNDYVKDLLLKAASDQSQTQTA